MFIKGGTKNVVKTTHAQIVTYRPVCPFSKAWQFRSLDQRNWSGGRAFAWSEDFSFKFGVVVFFFFETI